MSTNNIWLKVFATMAWVGTSISTGFISSESAQAQVREPRNRNRLVICESWDRDYNECRINTSRGVRIVRQLSDSSCRGNWGYGRGYIWVDKGCRAEFAVGSNVGNRPNRPVGGRLVLCESWDKSFQRCPINTSRARGVRLRRQLSNSSCRGNWGYGRDHVWVDNGCRAEFESYR
ncbi:MAG: DUF3011 domain-containing protein [Prochloraceae cyanobacterium]|nr:DUF3011 domain-containing protein [Prochloraceae cyanobacterium]